MGTDRQELKRRTYIAYSPDPRCPWCLRSVTVNEHLHEWLIKRNHIPKDKQHHIMVIENCILVHEECHSEHGQELSFKIRCLEVATALLTAKRIGKWYLEMTVRFPSLPKGRLEYAWLEYLEGVCQ